METRDPFVGRTRELEELTSGLARVSEGGGQLYLLAGPPGIGKTSLARAFSAHAHRMSAAVYWGRCWDGGGAPAFWPWVQVFRAFADDAPPAATDLLALIPELAGQHGPSGSDWIESDQARFQLFDAATRWLQQCTAARPCVVFLDDLHDADVSSLLLLQFVARHLSSMKMLIAGTYRPYEIGRRPEAAQLISSISREGHILLLPPFNEAEVTTLLRATAPKHQPPELARALCRVTGGVPYFVDVVLRLAIAESERAGHATIDPASLRASDEVRQVIRRQVETLGPAVAEVLKLAAVTGFEFEQDMLHSLYGSDPRAHLEAALRANLLVVAAAPGRFTFAHALLRDALYNDTPRAQREQWHLAAGLFLHTRAMAEHDIAPAEAAYHFRQALPLGDATLAISYALAAADRCDAQLAFEEAATWYTRALEVLDASPAIDVRRRTTLHALARVYSRAGNHAAARQTFLLVAEAARSAADTEMLARAALGSAGTPFFAAGSEVPHFEDSPIDLLREALSSLPEAQHALRAMLMARLAMELRDRQGDVAECTALRDEAVALAEVSADDTSIAYCLSVQHLMPFGAATDPHRAERLARILTLAEKARSVDLVARAHGWRIALLVENGSFEEADRELLRLAELPTRKRHPICDWQVPVFRAVRAHMQGRFDEGEQLATEALRFADRAAGAVTILAFGAQNLFLRRERSQLAFFEPLLRSNVKLQPQGVLWRILLAFVHSEMGKTEKAAESFRHLAADGFNAVTRNPYASACLCLLSEVCAELQDGEQATILYDLLQPAHDAHVLFAAAYCGVVEHYLGRLKATCADYDRARHHLDRALRIYQNCGAKPWLARAQYHLGLVLLANRQLGEAQTLFDAARCSASELGMIDLAARLSLVDVSGASPVARPQRSKKEVAVFRNDGDYWTVAFAGQETRIADLKGLYHIAHLLRYPGVEFPVSELLDAPDAESTSDLSIRELSEAGLRSAHLGDAGEILDAQAKQAYRQRLIDLRDELGEAEKNHDNGRADKARTEMEFVAWQLSDAVGIGGIDRRAASSVQRSRLTITKRIKAALRRVDAAHPSLGSFLSAYVRTGYQCSYTPPPDRSIDWHL